MMSNPLNANDSPTAFFGLTFLLSLPFYILNALAYMNVVGGSEMGAIYVALFTVTPIASASLLTYRKRGGRGLKELLARIFDFWRITEKRWYIAILLLSPLMFVLSVVGIVFSGEEIPPAMIPLMALPVVLPFFFILAAGEEVGWMGYAFEPMQARSGALRASLLLGLIWAFWHLPFFVFMMPDLIVLGAQLLTLVGTRVLVAWIFNNTGKSVFAAILFHAVDNTALMILPVIHATNSLGAVVHCGLVLVAVISVALLWGPRTLTRYRFDNTAPQ
jgi:membrane protease YdiL (CAAX protease family)